MKLRQPLARLKRCQILCFTQDGSDIAALPFWRVFLLVCYKEVLAWESVYCLRQSR